jgi:formate hydrogenlyase subunit 3/multisubunit Na+/H+ antiporter MnhD subunit
VLERIHGHLGWLSVAALLHPAILLRNPKRRARLAVFLTTLFTVVTASLGAFIYPSYRERLKQHIFIEAPRVGWLFERKEHLAVGALGLALVGCVAHLSLPYFTEEDTQHTVARLAHRAFVAAFVMALVVAVIGVTVASFKSF